MELTIPEENKMKRNLIGILLLLGLALSLSLPAAAQETANAQNAQNAQNDSSRVSRIPAGQKQRLRGVIVKREADSFILRDLNGADVQVNLQHHQGRREEGQPVPPRQRLRHDLAVARTVGRSRRPW